MIYVRIARGFEEPALTAMELACNLALEELHLQGEFESGEAINMAVQKTDDPVGSRHSIYKLTAEIDSTGAELTELQYALIGRLLNERFQTSIKKAIKMFGQEQVDKIGLTLELVAAPEVKE